MKAIKRTPRLYAVVDKDGDAVAGYVREAEALKSIPAEERAWPDFAPYEVIALVPEEQGGAKA